MIKHVFFPSPGFVLFKFTFIIDYFRAQFYLFISNRFICLDLLLLLDVFLLPRWCRFWIEFAHIGFSLRFLRTEFSNEMAKIAILCMLRCFFIFLNN